VNEPKVLFFSRDPGATNQLVAVHERLCSSSPSDTLAITALWDRLSLSGNNRPQAVIVGKKYALDVWRAAGIQAEDGAETTPQELIEQDIALVVTGTDDIDEPDTVLLWQAAQRNGIPVAVFLDNLVNLETRFRTQDGELITPDLIFVLDQLSSAELTVAGMPPSHIQITENLHLKRLKRIANDHQDARKNIRATWHVGDGTKVILFASENTAEMAAHGRTAPYDEHAILGALMADLAQGKTVGGLQTGQDEVTVIIRPHPRDTAGKYDASVSTTVPAVQVSSAGTPLEAILAADLVVGMDSALLFEAQSLGQPALSLVANSKFNEIFA
jgi:hypothetical protein